MECISLSRCRGDWTNINQPGSEKAQNKMQFFWPPDPLFYKISKEYSEKVEMGQCLWKRKYL